MNQLFGFVSAALLIVFLTVHAATFIPTMGMRMSGFMMLLHFLTIAQFFPAVLTLQRLNKEYGFQFGRFNAWKQMSKHLSPPLRLLCIVVFVYAGANFMMNMSRMEFGTTKEVAPGKYELHNKGKFIRTLTKTEADLIEARGVRMFSGHWIAFAFFAAVIFLRVAPGVEAAGRPKESDGVDKNI